MYRRNCAQEAAARYRKGRYCCTLKICVSNFLLLLTGLLQDEAEYYVP